MDQLKQAAQQALEALQTVFMPFHPAVTALKAALEQPEQATGKESLQVEQPEQEPVAIVEMVVPHLESIIVKHILGSRFPKVGDYLYTHPPRREWREMKEKNQ